MRTAVVGVRAIATPSHSHATEMLDDRSTPSRYCLLLGLACLLGGCGALPWKKHGKDAEAAPEAPRVTAEVTGVTKSLAANVRAHLGLLREACDAAPALQDRLAADAEQETAQALRAYGYYEPEIQTRLRRETGRCLVLEIAVQPGPRVRLQDVEISLTGAAAADEDFAALLTTLPLKPNTPLNHGRYADAKSRIESWAADHGYFDGRFTLHELRVQPSRRRASARLVFDSGARYDFGELRLTQSPYALSEDLIRRFLDYDAGEPYTSARIGAMNDALRRSDYFDSIDIRPRIGARVRGNGANTVPLDLTLVPRKRHSFSAGVGFSTDEALRTRFEYLDRRVNDRGHRILVGARASSVAQQLSAEYRVPRARPRNEWLSLQAGLRREEVDTFDTIEAQATLSETRERPFDFIETRFVEFNRQRFDIAGQSATAFFLTPGLRYAKTKLDDEVYPTRGYRLRAELKGASEALASDTDLVRALLSAAYIGTLPWRDRLLLRIDLGALWAGEFARLTPGLRFFTGGDASIRGYGFQDLGPVDEDGNVVGGRYLGVASVEYEHRLSERWSVAGFTDAGNAFGGIGRDTGIKTSVGIGVRWRSPIGPIRADLAHPLDAATELRLHLRVGPDL
ncbi:MAG TPA: autotransporter assembly complex family protein [Gammaproteobacteria bacterium]|nr:autotransporter assembly complex family protein [Gammaproteobacteria bacterium]